MTTPQKISKHHKVHENQNSRVTRWGLFILCLLLVLAMGLEVMISLSNRKIIQNRMEYGETDFSHHEINKIIQNGNPNTKTIIHLGTSDVAGIPYPEKTSIADFLNREYGKTVIYNLGYIQANIVTMFVITELLADIKSPFVLLGITPDLFPESDWNDPIVDTHLSLVEPHLTKDILIDIKNGHFAMSNPAHLMRSEFGIDRLTSSHLFFYSWLQSIKEKLYGNIYQEIGDKYLDAFSTAKKSSNHSGFLVFLEMNQRLKARGIHILTYISPVAHADKVYGSGNFAHFKSTVFSVFKENQVDILDLSNFLENTPENFLDFLHLTPTGNQRMAHELLRLLKERKEL